METVRLEIHCAGCQASVLILHAPLRERAPSAGPAEDRADPLKVVKLVRSHGWGFRPKDMAPLCPDCRS